jgi:hypothetical protein
LEISQQCTHLIGITQPLLLLWFQTLCGDLVGHMVPQSGQDYLSHILGLVLGEHRGRKERTRTGRGKENEGGETGRKCRGRKRHRRGGRCRDTEEEEGEGGERDTEEEEGAGTQKRRKVQGEKETQKRRGE